MHVLVTGGAGYIGSHVAHLLVDQGFDVTVVDDLSNGDPRQIPDRADAIISDLAAPDVLDQTVPSVDAIMHFAGSIVVPESVARPIDYWRNNAAKSLDLIDAAGKASVNAFVFSSTAAVYGEPDSVPIPENAPTRPINPYGQSKLAVEWMLQGAGVAHGLPWAALRYFNVAGAAPSGIIGQPGHAATHLVKAATRLAAAGTGGLKVFGTDYPTPDGTCIRDYVHVCDLAQAHLDTLRYLLAGGAPRAFNAGYGTGLSVLEIVDAVERVSGVDLRATPDARRPGDPARLIADASDLRAVTGWTPHYADIDTIVSHALAWERQLARRA